MHSFLSFQMLSTTLLLLSSIIPSTTAIPACCEYTPLSAITDQTHPRAPTLYTSSSTLSSATQEYFIHLPTHHSCTASYLGYFVSETCGQTVSHVLCLDKNDSRFPKGMKGVYLVVDVKREGLGCVTEAVADMVGMEIEDVECKSGRGMCLGLDI
ncbi:hypothetical protein ACMFMG_003546 [Clarireedia jacksonii]